jgi:hypothetical protein
MWEETLHQADRQSFKVRVRCLYEGLLVSRANRQTLRIQLRADPELVRQYEKTWAEVDQLIEYLEKRGMGELRS